MVYVNTVGTGPHRVMCLPGWFGSSTGWGYWPELVDVDACTFAFPDYRGYGARMEETGDYSLDEIAQDTLSAADDLGWASFSIVGHSMGGTAMQRVLVTAPGRVTKMVGISPVPSTGVPMDEQSHALFYGAPQSVQNRRAIIDFTTGSRLSGVWLDGMVAHSLANSTVASFAGHLRAWVETDFGAEVAGTPVPVLVIVGEHDPALSAAVMEQTYLQQYPNARMEVFANAGHYAPFETPVALATSIERFLAE